MDIFKNGARFVRFDCHLHTKSDKEFKYEDEENKFLENYINKLKEKEINVGIVTNHNKFNYDEFKNLKKKALKEEIFLIPGVELSVKEGSNGVHVLIAFSEEWISNGSDKINTFLDTAFMNVTENRENENTRCDYDLFHLIEALNRTQKDYFVIFAHVDQKSGLFFECNGGMITTLFNKNILREKTYALQKSHNNDNYQNFINWTNMKLPRIEGSDPKCIEDIGKGTKKTYIKIGDYSFNTVKNALTDFENRVSYKFENSEKHGYIESLNIEGGKFNGKTFYFSKELNNVIGIRGSGKSAVLEITRDILGLKSDVDNNYKDNLVKYYVDSGCKATLNIVDKYNRKYKIIKYFSDNRTYIENDKGDIENISVDAIIKNPLYFGQKDLSIRTDNFEVKLLEKLVGYKDVLYTEEFNNINDQIKEDFSTLINLFEIPRKITEQTIEKNNIDSQLKVFKEKGINEKLEKIQNFNNDALKIETRIQKVNTLISDINNATEITLNDIEGLKKYESKYNSEIFNEINNGLNRIITKMQSFENIKENINKEIVLLKQIQEKFVIKKDGFIDEFEKIKREINKDLNPDTYLKLNQNKIKIEESIKNFEDKLKNIDTIKTRLINNLKKRRELIMSVNTIYKDRIQKINESQDNIQITFVANGNKEKFIDDMKNLVRGSGIRGDVINQLDKFADYVGIMEDIYLNEAKELKMIIKDSDIEKISNIMKAKLDIVCKYISENDVEIKYHDKLLKNHSLGQRASAIILFIIEQKDNDLIIIDQPEDDLDNQVIYKELITTIRKRKKDIQFIFSTHNANIPVLGDAEQIICIKDDGSNIDINNNSIDNSSIQNDVVQIMEGGPEAFNRRQQIYKEWKINSSK